MSYKNTLIVLAEDCPATEGMIPQPYRGKETVATLQFRMLQAHPYRYSQQDVQFETYLFQQNLSPVGEERQQLWDEFFSKLMPCLRTSPLARKYGWGLHYDADSKIAIYAVDSAEYQQFLQDDSVKKVKAMRNAKAPQ